MPHRPMLAGRFFIRARWGNGRVRAAGGKVAAAILAVSYAFSDGSPRRLNTSFLLQYSASWYTATVLLDHLVQMGYALPHEPAERVRS